MIRKVCTILIILICVTATSAFAFDQDYRKYLTLGGGFTLMQETDQNHDDSVTFVNQPLTISSDKGFNGFLATGMSYDAGRVEFSLHYNQAEFEEFKDSLGATTNLEGNLKFVSFLMSVFWEFNKDGIMSPYFGGGIGACHIKMDDSTLGENRDGAAVIQLGIGLNFNISENLELDLGYKAMSVVEPNLGPINPSYLTTHNGNLAFRFLY
ncbi:MAG: hypothetical protein C0623_11615 [Desulfuromonas sp.]|nr:MAG: hypothetical protein C0623_11615 [Desulfuromonas sp.]